MSAGIQGVDYVITGQPYTRDFFVDDGTPAQVGVTGLINSSFTKKLFVADVFQTGGGAPTITVTEIDATNAPGWYKFSYTPNDNGARNKHLLLITHGTYGNPGGWVQQAVSMVSDFNSIIKDLLFTQLSAVESTMASSDRTLAMAIANLVNKQSVDIAGVTLTLYKTNGSTVLETYALTFDGTLQPIKNIAPN